MIEQQSTEGDEGRRKQLLWAIEKKLAEDVARPIILDTGRATAPRFRLLLPLAILVLLAGLAALIFLV